MSEPDYQMTLSLNVLEHLGINLYSNVPSVLSEAVANAWDADADNVEVEVDRGNDRIVIKDDGIGMTRQDVNERFLRVGYRRRDEQPEVTAKNRRPMGRKGIGKLSLFSIADVVEVQTIKNGEKSALCMRLTDIRDKIKDENEGTYYPEPLSTEPIDFERGTKIILTSLRRRQTISTARALKRRIARRFSIIGAHEGFEVRVDGEGITPADRDYYNKLQYIWTYGSQSDVIDECSGLARPPEDRTMATQDASLVVSGWMGTVHESRQLKDEESGDNLNRVAIFVRGKMAQEDMLDGFGERGVYASYLIGELRIDALDVDDKEDAATSSRQHIVEDDPRYVELRRIIGDELKHIQGRWSEWRADDGARKALEIPQLNDWVEKLPKGQRTRAKSWLGRIYRIRTDRPEERKELLKHAVFAFEFHRANENIEALEKINDENLEAVLNLFRDLDSLEANLYGQIVKQRITVIRTLQEKVDQNDLEKAIQEYLFDHLWLLDPHWERAEASELMEARVDSLFAEIDAGLSEEEKAGRIDIKYRKTAGTHVIVELKRPERTVSLSELIAQIEKYRSGLAKILDKQRIDEPIEIICLLGKPPREYNNPNGKTIVKDSLAVLGARFVLYDELLANAYQSYSDYLKEKKASDRLAEVIQAIEDFTIDS